MPGESALSHPRVPAAGQNTIGRGLHDFVPPQTMDPGDDALRLELCGTRNRPIQHLEADKNSWRRYPLK
jgi:hypothetical protein